MTGWQSHIGVIKYIAYFRLQITEAEALALLKDNLADRFLGPVREPNTIQSRDRV
jgi:hypothetical protein